MMYTINLGRTWFRNFRVREVRKISHLKQAKLGTLEYSGVNQAITVWIVKNNTIRLPRRRKKNDKVHLLSIPLTNDHIFSVWIIIRTYWERLKNISVMCRQCSAILFWNRSRDCSVCTTLEDGVLWRTPAQLFQRTWFPFCLFGVEGVKRTAKSSLPLVTSTVEAESLLCVRLFKAAHDLASWPSG